MKKILLSAVLLFLLTRGKAQDYYIPRTNYHPKHIHTWKDSIPRITYFFSFDIGISIPMRDYGSRDTTHNFMIYGPDSTNGKGFANVGFHASVSAGIFITPSVGVCAKIANNVNTFDQSSLNLLVNGQYSYAINDNYQIWQYMGGIFGNFHLGKKSSLWVQGMVGLINANFPSFSIYNLPQKSFPPNLSWDFTFPDANDLAYSLSLTYEKPISFNVSLIATATYTGSELIYPTFTYSFSGPYTGLPQPYTQNTPITMSFGSLDISVGMLFHF
jgi:hypothetical protein